jgi:hypothetical protein
VVASGFGGDGRGARECALLIWKESVKEMEGVMSRAAGLSVWVDGAGRGRGQDVATVITLIFAGQLSRSRMTVIRHRGVLRTSGRGSVPQRSARGFSAISASPDRDQRRPPNQVHAAAGTSWWSTWPAAQMKPANSRAIAVSALSEPIRRFRWR